MSNVIIDAISGNIINTISDHLGQLLILRQYSITPKSKRENSERKFRNFSKNSFLSDLKKKKQKKKKKKKKLGKPIFLI